jgi:PAS domain S-box-containing protein
VSFSHQLLADLSFSNGFSILLAAIPAALNLVLALYIRLRLSRNPTSGLFFFLTVAVIGWQVSDTFCRLSLTAETANFWDAIFSTAWIMVAPLSVHFALYFGRFDRLAKSTAVHTVLYGPALVFDSLYKLSYQQHQWVLQEGWGWLNLRLQPLESALVVWMSAMILVAVVLLHINIYRSRHDRVQSRQAWLIALGFSIPAFVGMVTEALIPVFLHAPPITVTTTCMSLFSIATLIGLTRFRLFHIPDFVNRRMLLDVMHDMVITVSRDYRITYANDHGSEVLGVLKGQAIDTPFLDLFVSETRYFEFLDEVETAYHAQRNIENFEAVFKGRSGRRFEVLISGQIIHFGSYRQSLLLAARDITAQKAAQKSLQLSEQRFRALIEKGEDGLIMMDALGNVQYGTPSAIRLLDYSSEQILRMNFMDIVHKEDYDNALSIFGQIIENKNSAPHVAFRLRRRDGGYIWAEGGLTNMLEEPGVEAIVGYFRDASERRQMERDREETLAVFDSVIKNMRSGILILDEDNTVFRVNNDFCEIFGLKQKPENLLGKGAEAVLNMFGPVKGGALFKVSTTAITMARQPVFQERIHFEDGRIYERDYLPINTPHGEFVAHLWMFRDITAEVRTLEQIRNQNAIIQQLYDASPYGIVMLDNEDRVLNANAAFEKLFGFGLEEMRGEFLNDLIVPNYLHEEASYISESCVNKESVQVESKRVRKDGTPIDVLIVGYPIVIDNKLSGIYGIYADITERKQAEVAIITKNLELEKINRELDRFVYSTSHDIRAPLMSVLGLINLAESESKDDEVLRYFSMMRTSIGRLDNFIKDIIHYSRNARLEVNAEPINFEDLSNEIVENLRYQDMTRNIQFRIDIDKSMTFYSDRMRVYTVLNNLVANAIKYHNYDQEAPFIEIKATVENGAARLIVADNGSGIPADKQDRIFDMFYRGHERSSGSGLGLYIVQEMIDKLQGKISVTSEEHKGSTFDVRLPNRNWRSEKEKESGQVTPRFSLEN